MCLLRAEVANHDLPDALQELGAIVDDIAIYKTVPETEDPTGAGKRLFEDGADWLTFTSNSTVEHFHARFDLPSLLKKFPHLKIEPALEAKEHTTDGLVSELLRAVKKN